MGEYWQLRAGGRVLSVGKNYVPDAVVLLFTDSDLSIQITPSMRRWYEEPEDAETAPVLDEEQTGRRPTNDRFVYGTTVEVLRARLALQGFKPDIVAQRAMEYLAAERANPNHFVDWRNHEASFSNTRSLFKALVQWRSRAFTDIWWRKKQQRLHVPQADNVQQLQDHLEWVWSDLIEGFDDPRFEIALAIMGARRTSRVYLELTNLLIGGWLHPDERPHQTARDRLTNRTTAAGSVIVVCEGRSDAALLRRALELGRPDLADQFRFLDFGSFKVEGGAAQVVSVVRALAAVGVSNRVIAVFDNDAAGMVSMRLLNRTPLPGSFTVVRLPEVSWAVSYPTLESVNAGGLPSVVREDVNRRAASIELMFGPEVLLAVSANSDFPPVRWTKSADPGGERQGSIERKSQVQKEIRRRLKEAESIAELELGMAEGCRILASMLVDGAADATPPLTSEFSPLLLERLAYPSV